MLQKIEYVRYVSSSLNCLDSHLTATELFQLPLYGSGTVFRSISHLLSHFLSSAVARRHTSSSSVTCNYCCRAREVTLMSFIIHRHVNCSYLLTYLQLFNCNSFEIIALLATMHLVMKTKSYNARHFNCHNLIERLWQSRTVNNS